MATKQIKIKILKSDLTKITDGQYISKFIIRGGSEHFSEHSTGSIVTTALHIFANSLWVLWDTIKMFQNGKGCITLDLSAAYYDDQWLIYKRPDGAPITSEDMFKSFEYILGFVLSNMTKLKPLEEFVQKKGQIDQSFIDNCPMFNNPLDFLHFLCVMTKPITNTLNESGNIRKSPIECFLTEIHTLFECTKCNHKWKIDPEFQMSVDLLLLLQKKDSKFIGDISSLVENNRAGIYIRNILFPIYHESLESHQCGTEHIKRFIIIIPPQSGSILFMINRYALKPGYVNNIIFPDDQMIINNMALSLTSATFFANSHYVVALFVNEDFVVIHDDMKEQSLVLTSLETFYKDFDKFEHKKDFNFFPDESYIFAYDTAPYSSENEDWKECAEHHARLFQDAKEISQEFIMQENCDLNVNNNLRNKWSVNDDQGGNQEESTQQEETDERVGGRNIRNDDFERFYAKTTCDPATNSVNIVSEPTINSPNEFVPEQPINFENGEPENGNVLMGNAIDNTCKNVDQPNNINWNDISNAFREFDGPNIKIDTLNYVEISQDLLKRSNNYIKATQQALPSKSEKKKHFRKDYSKAKALAIYKGEKPTHLDFLGIWQIPTNSTGFPKYGMLHYGHPYLQKQPSFYENPYSVDIWGLPGIDNENRSNLYSDLNLADLLKGVGTEDVCYTLDEHNQFTQNLQEKPFVIDDSTIEEPFFLVTPFWKSKQFQTTIGQNDFTARGIIGFIRSSPAYMHQYCKYISRSYFEGEFPDCYEDSLKKLECLADDDVGSIISCILNDQQKPNYVQDSSKNTFIDALLAYMHSPLQTRMRRVPLKDPAAQEAFNNLLQERRLPLFYFIQKVNVNKYPKRVLKCQVATRGSKKHKDFFMRNMDHYSGFVMPSKIFTDKEIRGKRVPNGWVVNDLQPWYLNEHLSVNRKLRSEAFLFGTRKLLRQAASLPPSNEIISSRNQKSLKTIYSLLSVCQLAFTNISIDVLKEVLSHAKTDADKDECETMISAHKEARDQQTAPSRMEINELVYSLPQLPVSVQTGNLKPEVDIDTDAALEIIRNGQRHVGNLLHGVCEREFLVNDESMRKSERTKKGQPEKGKRKVDEQVGTKKKARLTRSNYSRK